MRDDLASSVEDPELDRAAPGGADATTGRSTLTGGLWTSISYALPQIYVLVLSVVAARFLGPAGMGEQSFIAWVSISVVTLLTTGVATTFQRYVAEMLGRDRGDRVMELVHRAHQASFVLALVGGIGMIIVGLAQSELQSAWILAGLGTSAAVLHTIPHSLLLAYQRFREATMAGLVTGAFGVVLTIVVLALGGGIAGIFAVEAVSATVALLWLTVLSHRLVVNEPARSPLGDLKGPVLRYAAFATLVGLMIVVVERRSEFFALEAYSTPQEIAFYSIAFGGVSALARLVEGAVLPVVSVVATLFGAGHSERISSGVSRALRLMLFTTLPITAAGLALGGPAIELVYGSAYAPAESALLVLMWAFPLLALLNLSGATLDGLGRIRLVLVAMVAAAVVDLTLAVVLVPDLDAVGAACANVGAQSTGAILLVLFLRSAVDGIDIEFRRLVPVLGVSALAGILAALAASPLPSHFALVVSLPVFLGVLVVAALIVRPLPRHDAIWLSAAIGDRFGGRIGRTCDLLARPT